MVLRQGICVLITLLISASKIYSQGKIDSLKRSLLNSHDSIKPLILNLIAANYYDYNYDSGFVYAQKAESLAEKTKNENQLYEAKSNIAFYYFKTANTVKAFDVLYNALIRAQKTRNKNQEANFTLKIGSVFNSLGRYENGYKYSEAAHTLFKNVGDKKGEISALNNLGIAYKNMREYDKALSCYFKLLKDDKASNYTKMAAYGNAGIVYLSKKNVDSALHYFKVGLKLIEAYPDQDYRASFITNIGECYFQLDSFEKARSNFELALRDNIKTGNKLQTADGYHFLSKTNLALGLVDVAKTYNDSSLKYFLQLNNQGMLAKVYNNYIQIYQKKNLPVKALEYLPLYQAAKDSSMANEGVEKAKILSLANELEQKQTEIELLKDKEKILEEKNKAEASAKIWFWITIVALTILSVFLVIEIRKKIRSVILERQLRKTDIEKAAVAMEQKTKQLSELTLQMVNKNDALYSVKDSLQDLKSTLTIVSDSKKEEVTKKINDLSRQLKDNAKMDEDWDKFKIHFEELNSGFFTKLQAAHPNLTQNDLKICAYIHLKLDTNQVARILNISNLAVQKQRYRLRKKMGLENNADIGKHLSVIISKN